jgi:hypothetical protein
MDLLASIPRTDLEKIYELMYKYTALQAEAQRGGYGVPQTLSDRAYLESLKIEDELNRALSRTWPEFINVYERWVRNRPSLNEDAYVTMVEDGIQDLATEEDMTDASSRLVRHLNRRPRAVTSLMQSIAKHGGWGWEGEWADEQLEAIPQEIFTELIEMFYDEIVDDYTMDADTEEIIEEMSDDIYDEMSATDFLHDYYSRNAEIRSAFDEFVKDYRGLGRLVLQALSRTYSSSMQILRVDENFHEIMLNNVADIAKELFDVQTGTDNEEYQRRTEIYDNIANNVLPEIKSAPGASIGEQIIKFNLALTTAHGDGTMADWLLGVEEGTGQAILDELAAGNQVAQWDQDLAKMLGYEPGTRFAPQGQKDMDIFEVFDTALETASAESDAGNQVAYVAWHLLMSGHENAQDTWYEKQNTDDAFEKEDERFYEIAYDSAAMLANDLDDDGIEYYMKYRDGTVTADEVREYLKQLGVEG